MRNKKGQFAKGIKPWNKDTKGVMKANRTSFKKGDGFIPLGERFWSKIKKTSTCWLWQGSPDNNGYGRINVNGNNTLAHRVSYQLNIGTVPKGMGVLHKCDNPPCVNPEHLFLGTQIDNNLDRHKKGRSVSGEKHPRAKLNNEKVKEIRKLYRTGKYSHRELGKEFGVSCTIIFHIIHNNLWKLN